MVERDVVSRSEAGVVEVVVAEGVVEVVAEVVAEVVEEDRGASFLDVICFLGTEISLLSNVLLGVSDRVGMGFSKLLLLLCASSSPSISLSTSPLTLPPTSLMSASFSSSASQEAPDIERPPLELDLRRRREKVGSWGKPSAVVF